MPKARHDSDIQRQGRSNSRHGPRGRPQYGDPEEEDADPLLSPLALTKFNDELILIYPYAYVAIVQQNGSFEVSRMD